ncbi:MAG TPA: PTS fructose transporter subunit IIA [Methylibium sp.]
MAGIFIIAHAPLASALLAAASHAFPEAAAEVLALDVQAELPLAETEAQARGMLERAIARACEASGGQQAEVLILTDVFGATPANLAQRLAEGGNVKVVTGVNVPMLWRSLNYAQEPLDTLVARALAGGAQGVMQVATSRPQNQAYKPSANDQEHHQHQQ